MCFFTISILSHLLLWFDAGEGPSGVLNSEFQAIYDIDARTLHFIDDTVADDPSSAYRTDDGFGDGIALLDDATDTLILFGNTNGDGDVTSRTEINLKTGVQTTTALPQPEDPEDPLGLPVPATYCTVHNPSVGMSKDDYTACRDEWLSRLVPNEDR